jgi:membrane fusion protein, adhesin transport system
MVDSEKAQFDTRRKILGEQLAILDEQLKQKRLELAELKSRWINTQTERSLVLQQMTSLRKLAAIGAVSNNELLEHEKELQQIEGRLSDLSSNIPQTESAIAEMGRHQTETRLRYRTDAEKERSDTELEIAKLDESAAAMADRATRSEVEAPIAGTVNKLFASTVGGTVKSGEPLAQIVPSDASIEVEARLSPADRAEVWPGLPAVVKISAYDYSVYGGLKGEVMEISSDALQDERGQPYFRVKLQAHATDFGPDHPVVPGMVADVDILSGRQSVLEALLRPARILRDNALRL